MALDELEPLQGQLKVLDDTMYAKLRDSIAVQGFSFPFMVWRQPSQSDGTVRMRILDGHQRDVALRRMRDDEGWTVPKLPVVWIEADDERDAKSKILTINSRYGIMTTDSLAQFAIDADIDLAQLAAIVDLPEVDIAKALDTVGDQDPTRVEFDAYGDGTASNVKFVRCPECEHEFPA